MNKEPVIVDPYIPSDRNELEKNYLKMLTEINWLHNYIEEFYGDVERNYRIKFLTENPECNKV